ncbi:MAG: F0F1 ATP synthase subunit B [Bacilli bacterium]|nr:F0F1 ATP synthase subunit B [Bacilli bacterium]MBN2696675.1 F0F1 ATP synthase subunit B [Bacilli bacterium]
MNQFRVIFLETAVERIIEAVSDAIESALGITLLDILVQILATVVLVLVVRFFLWNKVTDYLARRREFVAAEIENAKQENEKAIKLKAESEAEYHETKERAKSLIETAKQKGESVQTEIIAKAKAEAKEIRENNLKEIEAEKEKARLEMKSEVIELAAVMAEKIIEQEVDRDKYFDNSIANLDQQDKQ